MVLHVGLDTVKQLRLKEHSGKVQGKSGVQIRKRHEDVQGAETLAGSTGVTLIRGQSQIETSRDVTAGRGQQADPKSSLRLESRTYT